ncbi:hypothetical protein BT93_L5219 [Corymbia citriodora subsp. variegata]|uniref:Ribosome assembly factor mrt4 n=1 Tax=Corymbia citriodora subsp. variegata TaxID=360336 RepID=A0A8T0CHB0_CORYI|nr:hypothetical protein BT93_L5219 [Corymbia citriodora subsp. variegata]
MPSSKRNRVIPTSKTRKNHKQQTRALASNIHAALDQYSRVFVFSVENVRNTFIKQVRVDFSDSRIFMGKTKVMAVALGKTAETEHVPGIHQLTPYLAGEVGLLLTNRTEEEVVQFFEGYSELDYARSGAVASQGFTIPHGELHTAYGVGGEEEPLPMAIEPTLRKLGVPTKINKGKVFLEDKPEGIPVLEMDVDGEEGYMVCKEGQTLDSKQTSILKIFGVRMSEFKMDVRAMFDKDTQSIKEFSAAQ